LQRADLLAYAVDTYGKELLPSYDSEWVTRERGRLTETLYNALYQLTLLLGRNGELKRAIEYGNRMIALEPLQEDIYRLLIHLHARIGQPAAAQHLYHALEKNLKEFGFAPSTETQALAAKLSSQRSLCTFEPPISHSQSRRTDPPKD